MIHECRRNTPAFMGQTGMGSKNVILSSGIPRQVRGEPTVDAQNLGWGGYTPVGTGDNVEVLCLKAMHQGIPPSARGQLGSAATATEAARNTPVCTGTTHLRFSCVVLPKEYPAYTGTNLLSNRYYHLIV